MLMREREKKRMGGKGNNTEGDDREKLWLNEEVKTG